MYKGIIDKDISSFILEKSSLLEGNISILLHKHNEVLVGMIDGGNIIIKKKEDIITEYIKELRVFSEKGEIYIWNINNVLNYRILIDENENEDVHYEEHYMWGNDINENGEIFERDRGMKFKFPVDITKDQLPLKYKVKNYYKYTDLGLIEFTDARLVEFQTSNREVNNG